jgi:hypothetical protein
MPELFEAGRRWLTADECRDLLTGQILSMVSSALDVSKVAV